VTYLPPPQPDQPTPHPSAQTEPGKPRRPLRTVLIIVGIVLVVCCGIGVAGGIYAFRSVSNTLGPVQDGAKTFFEKVMGGPGAYDLLCSDAKAAISRKEFDDHNVTSRLRGYRITGTNVSTINGRTTATVTVELTYGANTETHLVPMVNEGGTWKVCGHPY
jgi:hypothetical protein